MITRREGNLEVNQDQCLSKDVQNVRPVKGIAIINDIVQS